MDAGGTSPRTDEVDNVWNKLSRAMQDAYMDVSGRVASGKKTEQLPRVTMIVLKILRLPTGM